MFRNSGNMKKCVIRMSEEVYKRARSCGVKLFKPRAEQNEGGYAGNELYIHRWWDKDACFLVTRSRYFERSLAGVILKSAELREGQKDLTREISGI